MGLAGCFSLTLKQICFDSSADFFSLEEPFPFPKWGDAGLFQDSSYSSTFSRAPLMGSRMTFVLLCLRKRRDESISVSPN